MTVPLACKRFIDLSTLSVSLLYSDSYRPCVLFFCCTQVARAQDDSAFDLSVVQ